MDLIKRPQEDLYGTKKDGSKTAREKRNYMKRQDARSLSENESVNMKKKKIKNKQLSIIRDLSGEENSS